MTRPKPTPQGHSFSSANALYLHGIRHPSLPTGALTVAVALLVAFLRFGSGTPEAASAMPEVQEAARAVSPKIVLCRLFRAVVSDPRAAVFELRQIVPGDSFPHCVHGCMMLVDDAFAEAIDGDEDIIGGLLSSGTAFETSQTRSLEWRSSNWSNVAPPRLEVPP